MYPHGHVAVAYLFYSLYCYGRFRRAPRPAPVVAVIVGSLFADIIDKPLAWLGIFPGGRFVAHSLIFTFFLAIAVYVGGFVLDRFESATAFLVAHVSHLVADLPPRALQGYPFGTEFLFWPFLSRRTFYFNQRVFEPPELVVLVVDPLTEPFYYHLFEVVLFCVAVGLWYRHGCHGLQYLRH